MSPELKSKDKVITAKALKGDSDCDVLRAELIASSLTTLINDDKISRAVEVVSRIISHKLAKSFIKATAEGKKAEVKYQVGIDGYSRIKSDKVIISTK